MEKKMTDKTLFIVKEYKSDDSGIFIAADNYGEAADMWMEWSEIKNSPEVIEMVDTVVIQ